MNKTAFLALLALFVVPMAPNAAACTGVITEIIVEDGSPGGQGFYLDDRPGGEPVEWVYMENNNIDGLQTGGFGLLHLEGIIIHHDECNTSGAAGPDLLIY